MPPFPSDIQLLTALLAFERGMISREDLVMALGVWRNDKAKPMNEVLRDLGAIDTDQQQRVRALVEESLQNHSNNVPLAMAELKRLPSVRQDLEFFQDADVERSLGALTTLAPADRGGMMETLAGDSSAESNEQKTITETSPPTDKPGVGHAAMSNRFRPLRFHARGGLGEVFVARDVELDREVALKTIQDQYTDYQDCRSRFLLEAKVTGALEHPGIVPVYGLGQYEDGRPYYAMRFIRGDSLEEAVDNFHIDRSLDREERTLRLRKLLGAFIDVCNAMEFAHSRGVIHRDLKPGNVMIGPYGETLVVDWGLAKTLGAAENSIEMPVEIDPNIDVSKTRQGKAMGTPAYMSPEQARGAVDEMGPPSDIYSLGATLYYILTGRPPFGGSRLDTILQDVKTGNFLPPSSAHLRSAAPDSPKPHIPPALETICLKAMALAPPDRFASSKELAAELERWLADEEVHCYSEPPLERMQRWTRKHFVGVAATAAVAIAVLVGLSCIALVIALKNNELDSKNTELDIARNQAVADRTQAEIDRDNAEEAERKAEQATAAAIREKQAADDARKVADGVKEYLANVFRSPDPERDGAKVTVVEVLDQALNKPDNSLNPAVQAEVYSALGVTYAHLGELDKAMRAHLKANEALSRAKNPPQRTAVIIKSNMGVAYFRQGNFKAALPLLREAKKIADEKLSQDRELTLQISFNLATVSREMGLLDQALKLFQDGVAELQSRENSRHDHIRQRQIDIANVYVQLERFEDAEQLLNSVFKEDSDDPLSVELRVAALRRFANALAGRNELDAALAKLGQAEALVAEENTANLSQRLDIQFEQGNIYIFKRDYAQAAKIHREVLSQRQAIHSKPHPDVADSLHYTGVAVAGETTPEEGGRYLEQSLKMRESMFGVNQPPTITTLYAIGFTYFDAERYKGAEPFFEEGIRRLQDGGGDPARLADFYSAMATAQLLQEHFEVAEVNARRSLEIRLTVEPPTPWLIANSKSLIGGALAGQSKWEDAELFLLEGYNELLAAKDAIPHMGRKRLAEAAQRLLDLYQTTGDNAKVQQYRQVVDAAAKFAM